MVTHCSYSRDAHFYLFYTFTYNFCKDYTIIDMFAWAYFADKKAWVAKEPMRHGLQLKAHCHYLSPWWLLRLSAGGVLWASHALTDRYLDSDNSSTESLEALDWLKWIFKGPPKQHRENRPPHCWAEALTQYLMPQVTPDVSHHLFWRKDRQYTICYRIT